MSSFTLSISNNETVPPRFQEMDQASLAQRHDPQLEDLTHQTEKMNLNSQSSGTDHISKLPPNMLLAIFERCEAQDLLSLARVSKLHRVAIPMLYENVDLSSHNCEDRLCRFPTSAEHTFTYWMEASDSVRCNVLPRNLRNKQQAFISALLGNPKLATLVGSFTWTLFSSQPSKDTNPASIDPLANTWAVFTSLKNVRHLDLAWLPKRHPTSLASTFPSTLFPSAVSIRLTGTMPYTLVASILLTNPSQIVTLRINNLQQSGQKIQGHTHSQETKEWNSPTLAEVTAGTYFAKQGPMQNLLGAIAGKCTSLRMLFLRKVGQRDQFDYPGPWMQERLARGVFYSKGADQMAWIEKLDRDVYDEWARFLKSVKGSLQTLVIEQGGRCAARTPNAQPKARPMDRRFGKWIFPAIVGRVGEENGGWEMLQRLEIRGVQSWERKLKEVDTENLQGAPAEAYVDVEAELKRNLGMRVVVKVSKSAREADHAALVHPNDRLKSRRG